MHKICEVYHQKCLDNNDDVNLAFVQMITSPVGTGVPSASTLLFNRPIRALVLQMNKEPISFMLMNIIRPKKYGKINTLRAVIHTKTHFLSL